MSGIDSNARREVNDALISSGSAAIGQMVDTANSLLRSAARTKRSERNARLKRRPLRSRQMPLFVHNP